jgi:hypothetical protein
LPVQLFTNVNPVQKTSKPRKALKTRVFNSKTDPENERIKGDKTPHI